MSTELGSFISSIAMYTSNETCPNCLKKKRRKEKKTAENVNVAIVEDAFAH